jgi:hypothetical protein
VPFLHLAAGQVASLLMPITHTQHTLLQLL